MGLMGRVLGLGGAVRDVSGAVTDVAEVFVGNRGARDAQAHAEFTAVVEQYGTEFGGTGSGWFDGFVNGLNRLPRPLLALSTFALFGFAMASPAAFSVRMESLQLVPEPLWWLLGAVVSFYFGARELHYRRGLAGPSVGTGVAVPAAASGPYTGPAPVPVMIPRAQAGPGPVAVRAADPHFNAAIEEWRGRQT